MMTVLFHDIQKDSKLQDELKEDRILGAVYDEVLYADDTIIHSRNPETIQKLLHRIEEEGSKFGLKLNLEKCEHFAVGGTKPSIK